MPKPKTVDDYIAQFPPEVQEKLEKIRATIRKAAPKAVEGIGYGVAAYKLNGKPLIYFAGFRSHVGIYPRHKAADKDLADHITGKGTYRFALDEKLPIAKIAKLVKARRGEILG